MHLVLGLAVTEAVIASILESLSPDSLHILWSQNGEKLGIGAPVIGVPLVSEQVFSPQKEISCPCPLSVFSWDPCLPVRTGQFFCFEGKSCYLLIRIPGQEEEGRTV